MRRNAFTLIEVLVASLLMSMLVVILTMVFNQSAIAWRVGKANVSEMDQMRRVISQAQRQALDVLPGINPANRNDAGLVVSCFKDSEWDGTASKLRGRSVERISGSMTKLGVGYSDLDGSDADNAWQKPNLSIEDIKLGNVKGYVVGVKSFGPDGEEDTVDDISTWPGIEVD